jgi:hypothetical protein
MIFIQQYCIQRNGTNIKANVKLLIIMICGWDFRAINTIFGRVRLARIDY